MKKLYRMNIYHQYQMQSNFHHFRRAWIWSMLEQSQWVDWQWLSNQDTILLGSTIGSMRGLLTGWVCVSLASFPGSCLPTHESLGMRLVYQEHKMYVRLWVCVSLVFQEPSSVAGRTATCDQVHISCSSWKSRQEEQSGPLTLFQEPFIFCTCKVVYWQHASSLLTVCK